MEWVNLLLIALAVLSLVPVGVLCAECVAALLPRRKAATSGQGVRPSLTVLIPAHNEEAVLSQALDALTPQLAPGDRVLVVADNCDDATAQIAREHGVEVIERRDAQRRGKGYALDCGMKALELSPPEVVVMMDADCRAHPSAIDALARQAMATGRPAQACYLLERPPRSGPRDLVSALAFLVKNRVRPTGLGRLGLPCLLTGTGMAFPWHVIHGAQLASDNIVEDMQLGLDLTLAGHPPLFCGSARVTGRLPQQRCAAFGQRTRWEHGHLRTLLTQVPRLFKGGLTGLRLGPLALAFELSVPPLSLLALMLTLMLTLMVLAGCVGASWMAAHLLIIGTAAALICLLAAWAKFGRQTIPLSALLAAPLYVAWKIPMYAAFLLKPQKEWVRTSRSDTAEPSIGGLLRQALLPGGPVPALDIAGAGVFEMPPAVAVGDLNRDVPLPYPPRVELGGVEVHAITEDGCIRHILDRLDAGHGGMVVRPNLDHLRRCWREGDFAQLLASADLVVAEGMPLLWASRLQGTPLPARVAGSDLIWNLIGAADLSGRSIFLVGDDAHVTADAARVFQQRHPGLRLAGHYAIPEGMDLAQVLSGTAHLEGAALRGSPSEAAVEALEGLTVTLCEKRPDLIFVALESPVQERLIDALRSQLPAAWWLGVGTSFNFVSGDARSAPVWMRKTGLEWAHRMYQEPEVYGQRYLVGGLPYAASLLGGAAVKRLAKLLNKFDKTSDKTQAVGGNSEIDLPASSAVPASTASEGPSPASEPSPDTVVIDITSRPSPSKSSPPLEAGANLVYQSFVSGFASEFASHGPTLTPSFEPSTDSRQLLGCVRGVVLLGGNLRRTSLVRATQRSVMDLPLEDGRSLLWHWRDHAIDLRRFIGLDHLPVRLLLDQRSMHPTIPPRSSHVVVRVERDLFQYRGTGGVLRDLSDAFADDDVILVANGAQSLLAPLPDLAAALAHAGTDASLIWHDDGSPSSVMLFRCAALRIIAGKGYVDLKEQALPLMATRFNVRHLPQKSATALPIRTLGEYIAALQHRYRQRLGRPAPLDPFAEDCRPTFAIIEEGAAISAEARIHDSVVLRGAQVEAGSLVVRSIVCPGAVVSAGEQVVGQLVMADALVAR